MASIINVDQIAEATSGSGVHIPGHVVQVKYRNIINNNFSSTSSDFTDIDNWYVDITPKSSSNIIVVQTTITMNLNDQDGYGRMRIVDSNNSDTKWSTNVRMGSAAYYQSTSAWLDYPYFHINTAGTTNAMRLQFQAAVISGGTLKNQWSNSDDRIVMAMEIAQ